jgi:hypothetical protein
MILRFAVRFAARALTWTYSLATKPGGQYGRAAGLRIARPEDADQRDVTLELGAGPGAD